MDVKPEKSKILKGASDVLCPRHYQVAFINYAVELENNSIRRGT